MGKDKVSGSPNQKPSFLAEQHQDLADAHPNVPPALYRTEQARLLYEGIPVSLAVNALIASILVAIQRSVLTAEPIIVWSALLGATLVLRAVSAASYRRAQPDALADKIWLTRFRIGTATTGIAWGLASILLFPANDIPHQTFLAFAIAGMTAGGVTSLSFDLASSMAFIIPALAPLISRLFVEGGEIPEAMATMGTLYLGALSLISRRTYLNVRENIYLQFEAVTSEDNLRKSEAQLIRAQEISQTGSWNLDVPHGSLTWSPQIYRIFGVSPGTSLTYEIFLGFVHPDDREKVSTAWNAALRGAPYDIEHRIVVDEQTRWVRERAHIELDPESRPLAAIGTVQDITERKKAEEELRIAAIAFESQESTMVTDPNGIIMRVNHAFIRLTGYSAEEAVGHTTAMLNSGREGKEFFKNMWATLQQNKHWQGEIWNRHKNGKIYAEWLTISAVTAPDGSITHYVGTFSNIAQDPEASAEIHRLAYYDPLTHLPNRRLFMDRLAQGLAGSQRSKRYGALLFMDLDNFKKLNDTRGHDVGDQLLIEVAHRLNACVREGDTVVRLGGDEFVLMLEELGENAQEAVIQASHVGEKVLEAISLPYLLKDIEFTCTVSMGVTLFLGHNESIDNLLKYADLAMYQAKKGGRNRLCFFDPAMQATLVEHSVLENDLRHALERDQLRLYYQIQISEERRAAGAEALLRWRHPERGLIYPGEFIPLAEETGLIIPIGFWVLQKACAQIKEWAGNPATSELQLSVNVSARQFHQADFVAQVQQILVTAGINPERLKIELTESLVFNDVSDTINKMHALKALGVSFSMDDFGTGYSSLSNLQQLPLNQLKIDQSFIRDLATNPNDAAIVQAVVTMGIAFGLNVIAEGVETETQRELLVCHGCHAFQGYLFNKPMPIAEFETLIAQYA